MNRLLVFLQEVYKINKWNFLCNGFELDVFDLSLAWLLLHGFLLS